MLKKQWLLVSLLLFLLSFLNQGWAQSTYEVILPAQTQSLEERQALFEQGLLQLLGQFPERESEIKNPTDFVERYAYDEENRLSIHYSADLIDRLRTHVLSRVLLWLPENEVEEALQTQLLLFAKDKGLTLVWPLMDLEDRANNLTHASDRYHAQAVLSGIITESEAQWHLQRGENSIRWQGEKESLASCLMQGLTETVQYLTKPKAPIVSRSEMPFLITIHNIQSAQDFLAIEDYLRRLDIIKTVTIYQIEEERATFRISSHGSWEEALRLDPHLIPLPLLDLNYRWVP